MITTSKIDLHLGINAATLGGSPTNAGAIHFAPTAAMSVDVSVNTYTARLDWADLAVDGAGYDRKYELTYTGSGSVFVNGVAARNQAGDLIADILAVKMLYVRTNYAATMTIKNGVTTLITATIPANGLYLQAADTAIFTCDTGTPLKLQWSIATLEELGLANANLYCDIILGVIA